MGKGVGVLKGFNVAADVIDGIHMRCDLEDRCDGKRSAASGIKRHKHV